MAKQKALSILFFISIFTCLHVEARPYLEPEVHTFKANYLNSDDKKMPVLLVFNSSNNYKRDAQFKIIEKLQTQNKLQMRGLRLMYDWAHNTRMEGLWIINGIFLELNARQIDALSLLPNLRSIVWSQKPIRLKTPEKSPTQSILADYTYGHKNMRVAELRSLYPQLTGAGVRVGILDTGIVTGHPDLKGKLSVFKNFSPAHDNSPNDEFGHGTHVAGTIAGGAASGQYIGAAPQADLIVGRIFDGNASSTREQILQAMQWMADPDENPKTADHAQVVNSSWSDDEPFNMRDPENEPFCLIIKSWVHLNIIPVFSAGNTGPSSGTINLPAGCPDAFSVGATEQYDRSPHFSSTGPAVWKSIQILKPEISAPGVAIKSADRFGGYEEMSGTSMAAPHVSGAIALLLQAFPQATADDIKKAIVDGAKDLGDAGQDPVFGWGRVDVLKSYEILAKK